MDNTVRVKACFTSFTTKGSTVLQFELDSECKNNGTAGKLISMVRHMVTLDITDEQMVLDLNSDEETEGQMEAFGNDSNDLDEGTEDDQEVHVILELPGSYVEEVSDEEA